LPWTSILDTFGNPDLSHFVLDLCLEGIQLTWHPVLNPCFDNVRNDALSYVALVLSPC
jgi:hypothetical protein